MEHVFSQRKSANEMWSVMGSMLCALWDRCHFVSILRHLGLQLKMCGLDEKSGRANNSPTSILLNQTSIH